MKTTTFSTSTNNLSVIIENAKNLKYTLVIENRPIYRDVLVRITADEETLIQFVTINEIYDCIGEISEIEC